MAIELFASGSLSKSLNRVEGVIYDARLLLTLTTTPNAVDESVVIIDIDEKSMREQGRFPWSRSKIAELVTKLTDAGVAVTAFDIFFSEPEVNPVDQIVQQIPNLSQQFNSPLATIKQQVDADTKFAAVLKETDTVLGFLLTTNQEQSKVNIPKSNVLWNNEAQLNSQIHQFSGAIVNIEKLQDSAAGLGFINAHSDNDGFIRKAALINRIGNQLYPSLALEAARLYTFAEKIETHSNILNGITFFEGVKILDKWIETDEYGQILIPYRGQARSFPYYSATDVLMGRIGTKELEGAVAFIGTSSVGLADLRATPVGLQYPGVEVHANVFSGLMNPEIVPVRPNWAVAASLITIMLTGVILSFFYNGRGARFITLVSLIITMSEISLNFYLWSIQKISLPLLMPLLLIVILASYYIIIGSIAEMNSRRTITSMFNQYVPPAHIEQLIQQGKNLSQESQRREMTVLFADIRSFTALSENMTAHQLSEYLNQYLSCVTQQIFDHNGTIDKYVGDMVMAFWNAPLDDEKHAQNGVEAAMAMINSLTHLNELFAAQDQPPVKIGIGLSTGYMNVGDMGSVYRKAYTVLGDAVNLGARIESLTKFYDVDLLVSEETMLSCPLITFRLIDTVQVVGKIEETRLYEPINFTNKLNTNQLNEIERSLAAMTCFYSKDWEQALYLLEELQASTLFSSHIYNIFIKRIQETDLQALPSDWTGAFIHTKK